MGEERRRHQGVLYHVTVDSEELQRRVASFPFWYHRIELPGGVVTPGKAPIDPSAYRIPADLGGKRVLDVGAWDGYWTFEALRRGAREVVAIDDFSDMLGSLGPQERKAWQTFDLCRDVLGYDATRCKRIEMSVYDVSPKELGEFDVIFFFGTLYHLRHPLLALERLAQVGKGANYVESAILDDFSPYDGGFTKRYAGHQMVMEFYPSSEYGGNPTNWWVPTARCLASMVLAAGFTDDIEYWKLTDNPVNMAMCRGFAKGIKPS